MSATAAQAEYWSASGIGDVEGAERCRGTLDSSQSELMPAARATTNSSFGNESYDVVEADLLPGDLMRLLDEKRLDAVSEASTELGEETRSSTPSSDPARQRPAHPRAGTFPHPSNVLPPAPPMMPPPFCAGSPLYPPVPLGLQAAMVAQYQGSILGLQAAMLAQYQRAAMLAQYQYHQASLRTHYHAAPAPPPAPAPAPTQPRVAAPPTTAMFRNLPLEYDRTMLLGLLDAEGFAGLYDFVYLPTDFRNNTSFGYAFVNFVTAVEAESFRRRIEGFQRWAVPSDKVAEISWADPLQGLEAHVERYRDSLLMHESVPDIYKPALFSRGMRIAFPPPKQRLKAPRMRGRARWEEEEAPSASDAPAWHPGSNV